MTEVNLALRPSPFVLTITAAAPPNMPSVTRSLHIPVQTSPQLQVGQQTTAAR